MHAKNTMKKNIQIICPVFNEEKNISIFFEKFSKVLLNLEDRYSFSFLFLDNCSTDKTFEVLKTLCNDHVNVRAIKYSRNYGVMKSIYTGLIKSEGDAVAVFDCDLQDPPELIIDFVHAWENEYKVVYGVRVERDEIRLLTFKRKIFRNLESYFKGYKILIESGAWFLDKRVIQELRAHNFEPYLAGMLSKMGFKSFGVRYARMKRIHGVSKFNMTSYYSYAIDGLVSGTIAPLRLVIVFGVFLSFVSFFTMIYFLYAKFFTNALFANGVAATIIFTLFCFSINFIFLGIIGEYIGKIYMSKEFSDPVIIEEDICGKYFQFKNP